MVEMNDTGKRLMSSTGALSDPGHSQAAFELLSPFSLHDLATWLGKGAEKYAPRNWEKGIPFSICVGKLLRHLAKFQMGLTDEDHLSAVGFWWHALAHYRKMIEDGVLPAELDNLPKYKPPDTIPGYGGILRSCFTCEYESLPDNALECEGCFNVDGRPHWRPKNA